MEASVVYRTSIGLIKICCTSEYITRVNFVSEKTCLTPCKTTLLSDKAITQIKEYLKGERTEFNLPIKTTGTTFQQKVWKFLQTIPYGETVSYKQVAENIGCSNSARAVGMANNKNPIAIIIPCHRVIGTNGKLVGYAGGLSIKQQLLKLEKAQII